MIRSVGPGGNNLSGLPQRKKQEQQIPFPKISEANRSSENDSIQLENKPLMVGVKPNRAVSSIMQEQTNVVRLNADGDRLEVSRKAIQLAKQNL